MTRTEQKARERKLSQAGLVAVRSLEGYVTAEYARRIRLQVDITREAVETALSQPPKPRGRPKKEDK